MPLRLPRSPWRLAKMSSSPTLDPKILANRPAAETQVLKDSGFRFGVLGFRVESLGFRVVSKVAADILKEGLWMLFPGCTWVLKP